MENKRIAVINRTNFKNYGSVLQCFALCEAIKQLGYESEIVWVNGGISDHYDIRFRKIFSSMLTLLVNPGLLNELKRNIKSINATVISEETDRLFNQFVNNYINRSFYTTRQLTRIARSNYYDVFICGSDQIWNPHSLYLDPLLFLQFAPKNKRIAYAPSLGCEEIPAHNKKKLSRYVKSISYVSIRETKGAMLLHDLIGVNYPVVCDPTLLLDSNFWNNYTEDNRKNNYVLCYFLNVPSEIVQKQIEEFAGQNNKTMILLNSKFDAMTCSKLKILYPDCGPCEFLGYVKNADYIFTDSYHGMLFSIIFKKNFASIERDYKEYNQSSRQISILEELGLRERYGKYFTEQMKNQISYSDVYKKLGYFRQKSIEYLKNSIEKVINDGKN